MELADAFKSILTQPDLVKPLVGLLVTAGTDPEVQAGVVSLMEACFHKILLDKDTIDKFRIFVYNLMNMELEDSKGRNSSLLDLMLTKAITRNNTKGSSDIETIIEREREKAFKDRIDSINKGIMVVEDIKPSTPLKANVGLDKSAADGEDEEQSVNKTL